MRVCREVDDALEALTSLSLTPTLVHLKDLDQHSIKDLTKLINAWKESSHPVLAEADKLTKAQEKLLPPQAHIERLNSSGQGYRTALAQTARDWGIDIDPAALSLLANMPDPAKAVGIINALASAGITPASAAHVKALAGTETASGLPWLLLEAIDRGNGGLVDEHSAAIETPALTAYLGKRLVAAALISEGYPHDIGACTGGITEAALGQARAWASAHSKVSLHEAISAVARADHLAKTGHASEGLSIALAAYAKLTKRATHTTTTAADPERYP